MQPVSHPLYKKKVFFVGRFATCPRKEIIAKLEIVGGLYRDKLSSFVDVVVLGENPAGTAHKETGAMREAVELQKSGRVQILSESEFCKLL